MITTENLVTTIACGKNGKGTISVSGSVKTSNNGPVGVLNLQQLIGNVDIGNTPKKEEIQDLPSVLVQFFDIKSIDVYIKALEHIKKNMNNPIHYYALAC